MRLEIFSKSIKLVHNFGLVFTIRNWAISRLKNPNYRHKLLLDYLYTNFKELLDDSKYEHRRNAKSEVYDESFPIWYCWLQGKDCMPEIIRLCYSSILHSFKTNKVILISKDNLNEYVTFPKHIIDKYNKGLICNAHFSDIIRYSLLAKYGGLWIDSSVFMSGSFQIPALPFFTIKNYRPNEDVFVSKHRWATFFIYGNCPNIFGQIVKNDNTNEVSKLFFDELRECLFQYWEKYDFAVHYLLVDYFIEILYQKRKSYKELIDSVPVNNPDKDFLYNNINEPFNIERYTKICEETSIHKLNWHRELMKETGDGLITYYGHLLDSVKMV